MSVLKLMSVAAKPPQTLLRVSFAHYIGVFLVTALGLGLRFFMLGHQSLWIDEGYSVMFSDGPTFQDLLNRVLIEERHMSDRLRVLFYFVLFVWRGLFGDSEVALRSLSALFGFLATLLTYFTARHCFDKQRSLWSFLLISVSAYCVFYSQELRDYSMLMCLAAAQLFCLSRALYPPKPGSLWLFRMLFAFLIALGLFANILTVYFTLAIAVAHFLATRRPKDWFCWWLPAVVLSVLPALFYITTSNSNSPEAVTSGRLKTSILQHFGYSIYGFLTGLTYGPPQDQLRGDNRLQVVLQYWPFLLVFVVLSLVIVVMLMALFFRRWHPHPPSVADHFLAYTLLGALAFGVVFVYLTQMDWLPRHLCYLWPAFALLIPALVDARFLPLPAWKSKLAHLCLVMLMLVNGVALSRYYFDEQYYKDGFRAATEYTLQARLPHVKSVLIGGAGDVYLLRYYGDDLTIDGRKFYPNPDSTTGIVERFDMATQLDEIASGSDQVMLLVNREYLYGPPGTIEKEMSSLYEAVETVTFKDFHIYHLQKLP